MTPAPPPIAPETWTVASVSQAEGRSHLRFPPSAELTVGRFLLLQDPAVPDRVVGTALVMTADAEGAQAIVAGVTDRSRPVRPGDVATAAEWDGPTSNAMGDRAAAHAPAVAPPLTEHPTAAAIPTPDPSLEPIVVPPEEPLPPAVGATAASPAQPASATAAPEPAGESSKPPPAAGHAASGSQAITESATATVQHAHGEAPATTASAPVVQEVAGEHPAVDHGEPRSNADAPSHAATSADPLTEHAVPPPAPASEPPTPDAARLAAERDFFDLAARVLRLPGGTPEVDRLQAWLRDELVRRSDLALSAAVPGALDQHPDQATDHGP